MTEGVIDQATAPPETAEPPKMASDKARENFARLEAAKQVERDARIRAEMEREMLQKQIDEMKQHQATKDEVDPLGGVEDYVDKERLQQIRKKDKAAFQKEAEEIANRTYEARRKDEDRRNFLPKLKSQFGDYDQVMTEQNIAELEQSSPAFVNSVLKISDDYERRLLTYEYLKAKKANKVVEDKPSIKQRVEENQQNPYFVPAGSGTPSALEFDVKSKTARDQAYSKLKEAQRRPIGNGAPQR
jgi:hypothetical protein